MLKGLSGSQDRVEGGGMMRYVASSAVAGEGTLGRGGLGGKGRVNQGVAEGISAERGGNGKM